ncbi:response regulator transcription factor [Parapedobacter tibetensis]|uniref:response regulator transcription factor n=1 Tax=Parapedobacter tibetensis TaxID=2972951 RepID=UPI00214D1EE6|nr:response regulator transcription factor [Parapedobacter tibetensis]
MNSKTNTKNGLTVWIVDSHPVVSIALQHLLEKSWPDIKVHVAHDFPLLLSQKRALKRNGVDLFIVDTQVPGGGGIHNIMGALKTINKDVKVLFISRFDNLTYRILCLDAGARGFVSKHSSPATIITTVKAVLEGTLYAVEQKNTTSLNPRSSWNALPYPFSKLTRREVKVCSHLVRGVSMHDISLSLGVEYTTIVSYKERILNKAGVNHTTELIWLVLELGIIKELSNDYSLTK